jgi:putrescine aminotransferase
MTEQSLSKTKQRVFDQFSTHVSRGKAAFFLNAGIPFVFGKREGPYIFDIDSGKRLIDCHCNGGVYNLGHRHPEITAALIEAAGRLDIGNHHFVSREKAALAKSLAHVSPEGLDFVVFGVSGGEAVDTAIKVARKATGRKGVISAVGGYHGHTGLALAAGDPKFKDPFLSSSSDFAQIPFNDPDALADALNSDTAAVVFETIPATLGMPIPRDDYYLDVKKCCDKNGTLLIIDEVQTGLGRTGRFWGIEHYGIIPDMIVTAKGLGGGVYPVTATIMRNDLASVFDADPFIHVSTTGGADIGCEVARKVIEISASPAFLGHVNLLSDIFAGGMAKIESEFADLFAGFRQTGLMCGIQTTRADFGPLMTKACYDAGLLCIYAGNDTSVLQFLPPLVTEIKIAEEILSRLHDAFSIARKFINA